MLSVILDKDLKNNFKTFFSFLVLDNIVSLIEHQINYLRIYSHKYSLIAEPEKISKEELKDLNGLGYLERPYWYAGEIILKIMN